MSRSNKGDIESGGGHGDHLDYSQLRWAFIRKVYAILSVQLLLTIAVAAAVIFIEPIPHFLLKTKAGLAVYIVTLILPFLWIFLLFAFHQCHPLDFLILGLFTVNFAFVLGLSCAFTKGRIILEAAILTSTVFICLTLYTFWAVKRGYDFSFFGPFLFSFLEVLIVFGLIQIFFPLGKFSLMIYGFLGSIVFCGYIIYDTGNLIKRYDSDDYIWAAAVLYLDIINLFSDLLLLLTAGDD